ncbi:DNA primase family protein [Planococcus soli]|uniref:DNA primase family protein n=1 Tax=Planococcus soli TaxID=2666072 RepID=UPI00163D5CFE|nr:phage/plasmid primase, P4 family [Planococcus soli]
MSMNRAAFRIEDVDQYITDYPVQKARPLDASIITKGLLESVNVKDSLSLLVAGLNTVMREEGLAYFTALMYQVNKTSRAEAMETFKTAERTVETVIPEALLKELELILSVSRAEERGYSYNEKKKSFTFNANAFAKHFIKRCHLRSTNDGRLFIYNLKGVFEEPSEVKLGKIIMMIMHEGRRNSWKSSHEVEVVKALQREAINVDEMNVQREFINLKNGMFSLDTYKLYPHSPKYISTIQIPIDYDPLAGAPNFNTFMEDITLHDAELIGVHQELVGYWLSVETKAEKAVYYHGGGANGKSVLASVVTELIGKENVSSVPLSDFSHPFGLESMIGKSINIAAENELGGKALKTENFKAIVSGDTITVNLKYRPAISYTPYCRLLFLVNSLPDSMDVTNGYFRKLMIVPFNRTFSADERNVNLKEELLKELQGILNWALEGLKRLRLNNFQFSQSDAINECQNAYNTDQNPVKEFYLEHIRMIEGERTKQADFHLKYLRWLDMQGIDDKGTKSLQLFWKHFKIVLENERIPIIKKKVKGAIYYDGLKVEDLEDVTHPTISGSAIQY